VPGVRVGPHTAPGQQLLHGKACDPERRLRHLRRAQPVALGAGLVGAERGRWEHRGGDLGAAEIEDAPQLRQRHEQLGEHAGALAALPREQDSHLAVGLVLPKEDPVGGLAEGHAVHEPGQLVEVPCYERQPYGRRFEGAPPGHGPREVAQCPRPARRFVGRQQRA
jgi:hypothetical protein